MNTHTLLMDKIFAEIGARMLDLRKALKLTQSQVAERAGVDPSFYGQIERGKAVPSLKTFIGIASALHADPADLLPPTKLRKRTGTTYDQVIEHIVSDLNPGKRRFVIGMLRDVVGQLKK